MKRVIVFFCLKFFIFHGANAGSQHLFSIDVVHIRSEMACLTQLENYLADNDYTMIEILDQGVFMLSGINTTAEGMHTMFGFNEPALGFPSFLWGLCLSLPGVLVVHFVAHDRAETAKAILGCIVGAPVYLVGYAVFYFIYYMFYGAWVVAL